MFIFRCRQSGGRKQRRAARFVIAALFSKCFEASGARTPHFCCVGVDDVDRGSILKSCSNASRLLKEFGSLC
uniref:Secreted protein n=1 Tax=Ascaris lumbricoides TaxID=6252 RepID=A0A0M3I0U2_ASCLU